MVVRVRNAPVLHTYHPERKGRHEIAGVVAAIVLAAAFGTLLAVNMHQAVAMVFGLWVLLVVLLNPLLMLTLFLAQLPLIPRYGYLLGVRVPDLLTPVALCLFGGSLVYALASRRRDVLKPRAFDLLLVAFLLIAFRSVRPDLTGTATMKYLERSLVAPALFYFAVRWLAPAHRSARSALGALSLSTIGLASIMLVEAGARRSILYQSVGDQFFVGGIYQPGGAFGGPTLAGAFLVAVLPMLIYFASASGLRGTRDDEQGPLMSRVLRFAPAGAVLALVGIGLCLERGVWIGAGFVLLICSASALMRRRALTMLGVAAMLPLVMVLALGGLWLQQRVYERSNVTDRMRMLKGGVAVLHSGEWRPALGIGLGRFAKIGYMYIPPASFLDTRRPEEDTGRLMHNDYLNLLVETGILGAGAFLALLVALSLRFGKLLVADAIRSGRASRRLDRPLVLALLAGVVSVLALAATHNTIHEAELMSLFWVYSGLAMTDDALAIEGGAVR